MADIRSDARPRGRFGFTVSPPTPGLTDFQRDITTISDLGVGWVRFGVIAETVVASWLEGDCVRFDDAGCDLYRRAFDIVERAGLKVCLLTVDGVTGVPEATYLSLMEQYWTGLAKRFGQRVAAWQVFNEASDLDFRTAGDITGSVADYHAALARALGAARAAIHRCAPGVAVTTNAGGYPLDDAKEANWQVFFAAVAGRLDVVTVDVYPVLSEAANATLPDRLARLERATGKPLAVGEFGLQTGAGLYTETEQADSLTMTISALARTSAAPVFVYRLRDDGAADDDGFGVLKQDGSPKSSLETVAAVIAEKFPDG